MNKKQFEMLNSKQIAEEQAKAPIVYFSIGSLEHHGQHIPVGFDSLWIHKACLAAAQETGGVVLPPTFWGTAPCVAGIENMSGSLLLKGSTIIALASDILDQLIDRGYKTIVAVAGHNPGVLGRLLAEVKDKYIQENTVNISIVQPTNFQEAQKYPEALKLAPKVSPDHAGKMETSLALHLYPNLVKMANLDSAEGNIGVDGLSAKEASSDFGKYIFDSFVEFMVQLVNEA